MKRYTDVNHVMINHIPNHTRNIKTVDMTIRLSVVMMISIVNQFRYVEDKMLFISSLRKMLESTENQLIKIVILIIGYLIKHP